MSPQLKDQIAKAVVVLTDRVQKPDDVHQLITGLCALAESDGELQGIDRARALVEAHLSKSIIDLALEVKS